MGEDVQIPRGCVVGFSTCKGVLLDLDHINKKGAIKLCDYLLERYDLRGYILLKTSTKYHYHAVFNRYTTWRTAMMIIFRVDCARDWAIWQAKKGYQTIRVTTKEGKDNKPNCVHIAGEILGGLIHDYWKVRGYVETLE